VGSRVARLRDPLTLAVGGLAVHRLTRLAIEDEITRPAREAVQKWARGDAYRRARPQIDYLTTCPWCVSIYAGTAFAALTVAAPGAAAAAGAVLAWSTITGLIAARE
jgi:hypothetical protein